MTDRGARRFWIGLALAGVIVNACVLRWAGEAGAWAGFGLGLSLASLCFAVYDR